MLLLDEPTASLDLRHQLDLIEATRRCAERGTTVIAILHDLTLAARFADRVLVMDGGRIVADDVPGESLSPQRVAQVFGVEAMTVDTGEGMALIARRPL